MFSRKPIRAVDYKNLLHVLIGMALLTVTLTGCEGLLTEEPTSFVAPENFYRNEGDALSALAGAYNQISQGAFGGYIGSYQFIRMTDKPSGEYTGLGDHENLHDWWQWGPAAAERNVIFLSYDAAFEGINAANAVIDNVPSIEEMDAQLKTQMVAEARFLRALHYYYLVGLFGGVPIIQNETSAITGLQRERAPENRVYTFLIDELGQAISNLPLDNEQGRATKGAAQTLLTKVYLQRGSLNGNNGPLPPERQIAQPEDFQRAVDVAQEVIDSGKYELPSDVIAQFNDLFVDEASGGANPEIIFALQQEPGKGAGTFGMPCLLSSDSSGEPLVGASWNSAGQSTMTFFQSFEDADLRKEVTFLLETPDEQGGTVKYNLGDDPFNPDPEQYETDGYKEDVPVIRKYVQAEVFPCDDENDVVILRYADVLLMKAEALNEVNNGPTPEAYDAINQVRERAGLDPLSGLSYEAFREAIYMERRKELILEGHGWHALTRFWDIATRKVREAAEFDALFPRNTNFGPDLDRLSINDHERLWPIPQAAIGRNPSLSQNPGY